MSEATTEAVAKPKTEVLAVTMTDGRVVNFAGKRKLNKETVIDASKVEIDEAAGILQLSAGAVSIRMDFRNGDTRLIPLPLSLLAQFAGHGGEQKFGDNLASPADKPLSEEDMVIATDELAGEIAKGKWGKGRAEGGGAVSGASIVVKAIMEVSGKSIEVVKAFLEKKLAADANLTRRALYDSFRVAGTPTGIVIKRMEEEKLAKTAKVDAGAAMEELAAE